MGAKRVSIQILLWILGIFLLLPAVAYGSTSLTRLSAPSSIKIEEGLSSPIVLKAVYSDNSEVDIASSATWVSNDESIATVVGGTLNGVGSGVTTLKASYGGQSVYIYVQVTPRLLRWDVQSSDVTIPKGQSLTIKVTAFYENGTKDISQSAVFESVYSSIVSVSEKNKLTGLKPGESDVNITFMHGDVSENKTIHVTVMPTLTKLESDTTNLALVKDVTRTVYLTATYSSDDMTADVTDLASWSSNDESIATVENGLITAKRKGSTTIKATYCGKSVTVNITVTSPISILDASLDMLTVAKGKSQTIKVSARFSDSRVIKDVTKDASITSSDLGIISVSGSSIKALYPGSATLTIEYGGLVKTVVMVVTLSVTKLEADTMSLGLENGDIGNTGTVKLTVTYSNDTQSDVTELARWTTSNADIATVKNNGEITAGSKGTATITGKYGDRSVKIDVKVTLPIVRLDVSPGNVALTNGKSQTIKVTAVSKGLSEDVSKYTTITSDDEEVAVVTGNSVKVLSNTGNAKLTISYGIQEVTMWVYATDPIKNLEADTKSLGLVIDGTGTVALTATYNDADSTVQDVSERASLTSSNIKIVTIENGLIKGLKKGTATVTATYGGRKVTINVRVTSPVQSLSADDDSVLITKGKSQTIKVRAVYNDDKNSIEEVSKNASIKSNNTGVVKVNGNSIIAVGEGEATLTIEYGGIVTTVNIVVKLPVIELTTDGPELELIKNGSGAINLYAKYKDDSQEEVSLLANWKSSDVGVVTVNHGYVTGVNKGTATITGTYFGKSVKVKVTVTLS